MHCPGVESLSFALCCLPYARVPEIDIVTKHVEYHSLVLSLSCPVRRIVFSVIRGVSCMALTGAVECVFNLMVEYALCFVVLRHPEEVHW